MGVFRLSTYIIEHDDARRTVHLAELADRTLDQTGKMPKLICDYISFKRVLFAELDYALIRHGRLSQYSLLYGGNYQLYAKRVLSFVRAFQHLGIDLVFFVDGPLGINETELQAKLSKQKARYLLQLQCVANKTQVCDQKQDFTSVVWESPQLASLQALMTLRDAGAQIIICQGEADMEIAEYSRSHKEVLGILSTDTDFSIMKNCVLFPIDFFDSQDILGFSLANIDETPGDIVCEVVSPATLASSLDIKEEQLPDLSILCGNDYTTALNRQLDIWTELELEDTDIESVANWLQEKDVPLVNYQPMNEFLLKHPEYFEAVQRSYRFYTQNPPKEVQSVKPMCPFYSTIKEEIRVGCMLYDLLTVVKNDTYWRPIVCESLTLGHPSMHDLLLPVRKIMYMLLGLKCVREFGRTPTHSFTETSVNVDIKDTQSLKLLHSIRGMDNDAKIAGVFHLMVSACDTPHFSALKDTLEKVVQESPLIQAPLSVRDAMVCTALQYTTKTNETLQSPYCFTDTELTILVISCLTCCAQLPPLQTTLLPSMRAVTFSNRFLHTLKHVYYLASLVGLGRELPEPKDLFYSMAFVPYHMLVTHKSDDNDDNGEIEAIRAVRDTVLSLEAVRTFNLAIVSPDQPPKFCELVHLFSSAVKAVENNRESLTHGSYSTEVSISTTESEESLQTDEDEESPPVPQILSPDPTVSSNQKTTSSITNPWSLQTQKPKTIGFSKQKDKLPVFEHRDNILHLIASHRVVCIVGETGCGKSSQIPQYIIDDSIISSTPQVCKVLVSQPNHTAAINLAKRVAGERKEEVGGTVGYCSERKNVVSKNTLLTYCTTEHMLENLACQGVCCYTHVIVDEVHDRSINTDFILLVVRNLALKFTHLKIVLMSATLQSDLFVDYFEQLFGAEQVARPYFVGVKRFPIAVHFIDQLDAFSKAEQDYWNEEQLTAVSHLECLAGKLSHSPELASSNPTISEFAKDVCTELIISQGKLGEGILVFLPGFSDITDYYNQLSNVLQKRKLNDHFLVFVFHARLVPNEEQDTIIFGPPPRDKVHVILSSKVAESSITIPKLRMIINFGINQNVEYDSRKKISRLQKRWCSRSSCSQREGRVGRVFEGIAVHLFTEEFFENTLSDFDAAEIAKSPLPKAVLKAKQLGRELNIPLPSRFLSQLIEPPSLLNMEAALQDLVTFGAIVYDPEKGVREDADITLVGKFCLSLPLDLKLGRLIIFGIFFGCPFDAIVMAAALSMYQDTFTLPTRLVIKDLYSYCRSLKRSMDSRVKFDYGYYSDPIRMCNMFIEWIHFRNKSVRDTSRYILAKQFSYKYSVRPNRLLHFESLVGEIASYVCQYIPSTGPLFKQMQLLSHVVEHGSGRPYFENPGASSHHRKLHQKGIPFCDDSIFLKAVIAAAFANQLIYGKRELESFIPYLRKRAEVTIKAINDVNFDPCRTIAMDVGERDDEDEESEDEEVEEIDENILQKLVKKMLPRRSCETKMVDNIALIQFEKLHDNDCISDFVRFFWQFPEGRDNWQIEGLNASFPMPFHPYCLRWSRLTIDRENANSGRFDWRNPMGFVCKMSCPSHPLFAVASEMIAKNDYVYVSHITMLPQMPQGLLMMLAFQPISTNIEVLLEKEEQNISAVRINSRTIERTATYINAADIWRINKLRKALSEAIYCSLNISTIPIDQPMIADIPALLQDVLFRRDISDLPIHITNATVARKGTLYTHPPASVWETVVPGADYDAVTKSPVDGNEVSRGCYQFYPPFQCSLAGGQPHSMKEVEPHGEEKRGNTPVHTAASTIPYQSELEESNSIYVIVKECADQLTDGTTSSANIKRMDVNEEFSNEIEPMVKDMSANVDIGLAHQPIHSLNAVEHIALETVTDTTTAYSQCEESSHVYPVEVTTKTSEGQQRSSQLQSLPIHIRKLEQEIVRYLKGNNMMEFLSKLQKNKRVKLCCRVCNTELNRAFFVSRPQLFQVMEEEDDDELVSLIVLNPTVQNCQSPGDSSSEESEEFKVSHSSPETSLQPGLKTVTETSTDAALPLIPSASFPPSQPKTAFAHHLVQYFVDYLQKGGGEASISSLRKAFATYVKMLPGDTACPHPLYIPKSFFESHPQYFKLVQGCGFCTVKLMTSTDSESLTSGNAASSIQNAQCDCVTASDPEPTVKQKERSDVTGGVTTKKSCNELAMGQPRQDEVLPGSFIAMKVPDTSPNDVTSSSNSDLGHRMDVRLQPTSSSVMCQPPKPDSEGDSRTFTSTMSSTIQHCSYVSEAGQISKLQPSDASLSKTIPHKSPKPGSEEHVIDFFIDYLKTQNGEASITSLQRKAFPIYLKRFSNDVKDLRMNKEFFKSHPQYFKLIQGDGFCTVRLSRVPPDESRCDACDRNTDSAVTALSLTSDSDPKLKQKTVSVASTATIKKSCSHLTKAEVSMCEETGRLQVPPDEKTSHAAKSVCSVNVSKDGKNVKLASSIPEHQYSISGSGKTVSGTPSTVQPSGRKNSKLQPRDTLLTTGHGPIPPKPGSDQHMVEFFVDYLKKRGGEASLSNLLKKAFPLYVRAFPKDVVYLYLNKWFFESRPQYFELIQGPGFCTVRPARVLAESWEPCI